MEDSCGRLRVLWADFNEETDVILSQRVTEAHDDPSKWLIQQICAGKACDRSYDFQRRRLADIRKHCSSFQCVCRFCFTLMCEMFKCVTGWRTRLQVNAFKRQLALLAWKQGRRKDRESQAETEHGIKKTINLKLKWHS